MRDGASFRCHLSQGHHLRSWTPIELRRNKGARLMISHRPWYTIIARFETPQVQWPTKPYKLATTPSSSFSWNWGHSLSHTETHNCSVTDAFLMLIMFDTKRSRKHQCKVLCVRTQLCSTATTRDINIAKGTTDPRHWVLRLLQHLEFKAEASTSIEILVKLQLGFVWQEAKYLEQLWQIHRTT